MKWYIPSWNGDLRLESDGDKTKLTIFKPTEHEKMVLKEMNEKFIAEGWFEGKLRGFWGRGNEAIINAPIEKVGPIASAIMRPGDAVLTAIKYADGTLTTHVGTERLEEVAEAAKDAGEKDEKKKPEAAATVKRPTPCCPHCIEDTIDPATEVLLTFLDDKQHESWVKHHFIVVQGNLSGHRYLLAHRNSEQARVQKKICWDLDDDLLVHFHDWSVPPEEEVLAAKLILENQEPWLRNEATLLGGNKMRFKNPFGDVTDGTEDAAFAAGFGRAFAAGGRS